VLDVGCGFKPFKALLPVGYETIGIDYSRQVSAPDFLASADKMPFRDSSFDAIICSEVLEHTRYIEVVIQEMNRVVKNNGLIFISTPYAYPEHGIPYDFQRPTRYLYFEAFGRDNIVHFRESNSTLATGLTCFNFFMETSPLRLLWGVKHLVYSLGNGLGLMCDFILEHLASRLMRSYRTYFFTMPIGFALVIRVRK
jgi:SAM-dependent methyltransferase